MTTTQEFNYVNAGEAYSGSVLWRVETPAGEVLGHVASSDGKRGKTWMAYTPLAARSVTGFRNREAAAKYLARVTQEDES